MPQDFGEHPIGTGPWKLVEWKHDDYLLFTRNDSYWGGAPKADSLRARIIAEPSTAVAEYEEGNVDVLQIPPLEAREWTEDQSKQSTLMSVPATGARLCRDQHQRRGPRPADVRVRQAINYAIDVDRIIERLVSGRGTHAAGVIPPALAGYDSARRPYGYDPARAKQLLAEAGHPGGIDVELWCSTSPLYVRIAETMQAYLGAVGIRTKIMQREAAAARAAARKGDADMILKDWYADYPDAEDFLFPLLHGTNTGSGGNISFYANPIFDSLVTASRGELDETRRNALYRQADSLAHQGCADGIPAYFYNDLCDSGSSRGSLHFQPPVIFNGQRWLDVSITHASGSGRQAMTTRPHTGSTGGPR